MNVRTTTGAVVLKLVWTTICLLALEVYNAFQIQNPNSTIPTEEEEETQSIYIYTYIYLSIDRICLYLLSILDKILKKDRLNSSTFIVLALYLNESRNTNRFITSVVAMLSTE